MQDGLFVPFRGRRRHATAVGTFSQRMLATGAAGGGTVAINAQMPSELFGFKVGFVPLTIVTQDALASAVNIRLFYSNATERVQESFDEILVPLTSASLNYGLSRGLRSIFSVQGPTERSVISAVWTTNTDTFSYELHIQGLLFDMEAVFRGETDVARILEHLV